jgi:hypothetical protein
MVGSAYRSVEAGSFELPAKELLRLASGPLGVRCRDPPFIDGGAHPFGEFAHLDIGSLDSTSGCILHGLRHMTPGDLAGA